MSESSGSAVGIMDARRFFYIPKWAKTLLLCVAALLFCGGAFALVMGFLNHSHDLLSVSLTAMQTGALMFTFFVLVLFSSMDGSAIQVEGHSATFLTRYIVNSLERVSLPELNINKFTVEDLGQQDIFGHIFLMKSAQLSFKIWVGLNVNRIFVIYFLPADEGLSIERAQQIFAFTFGGAEKLGYHANYEEATVADTKVLSIWLTVETTDDLISSPKDKLFWAQDVAMMTQSFLRTANRAGLKIKLDSVNPGPL